MTQQIDDLWLEKALLREGESLTVYLDTEGYATVGIGHKVLPADNLKVGDTITRARSRDLFIKDSAIAKQVAITQAKKIGVDAPWFIVALISVNFQLGAWWIRKFRTTWHAIVRHDYDYAINNLHQSKWYKQTPVRVEDFIEALERAKHFKKRPLPKTRTIQGAATGAVGTVLTAASEPITEAAEQIEPLSGYSDGLQWIFILLTLAGIGLTIYARIDDREKGLR